MSRRLLILPVILLALLAGCGLKRNLELPGGKHAKAQQTNQAMPATTAGATPVTSASTAAPAPTPAATTAPVQIPTATPQTSANPNPAPVYAPSATPVIGR